MKPPARSRRKPQRFERTLAPDGQIQQMCRWPRADQMKLLGALRSFGKTAGVTADLDFIYLRKCVRSRSASEIVSVVEALKAKVISSASISLKTQSWRQNKDRKPIEVWTDMASAVSGALDHALSLAFTQMLMVSSTEPRTLAYSEPTQSFRPPTHRQTRPPPPCTPLAVPSRLSGVGTSTVAPPILIIKAPPLSIGPAHGLLQISPTQLQIPSSEPGTLRWQPTVPTASPQSAGDPVTQATLQHAATSQPAEAPSSSQNAETTPASSETIATSATHPSACSSSPANKHSSSSSAPIPSCTPSSPSLPDPTSPFSSTSSTALPNTFGRVKACPRGRNVVNFEKIYQFLSVLNKDEECSLTAMESAIMLDLLMSLTEELSLLDCNKLHHHFVQVHCCLSGSAGSKMAAKMFKGLKPKQQESDKQEAASHRSHPKEPVTGPKPQQNGTGPEPNGDVDRGHTDFMDRDGKTADVGTERLCPPLNPFMVPLDLLTRRSPKP
ncbi:uncharacterized protein snapc2 [Genypterus blacodes]|uniref:uncharacterized protein snapc2 n=1 Tax=Genypterus blacodes TaxID=154954 RepID=UPI003F76C125